MKFALLGGQIKIEVGDDEQASLDSKLEREDATPAIILAKCYNAGIDTIESMLLSLAAHGIINEGNVELVDEVIVEVLDAIENNFENFDDDFEDDFEDDVETDEEIKE